MRRLPPAVFAVLTLLAAFSSPLADGSTQRAAAADGRRTATAGPAGVIVTVGDTPSEPIAIDGTVRSLVWTGFDEPTLWVLRHRPARKRAGTADLLRVDLERGRTERVLRLPVEADALLWWPLERSLLVVAGSTLRTIRLDGLRSGPMFRLAAPVRAATLLGGSRLLLAEASSLVVVDLWDRPGPDAMPERDRLTLDRRFARLTPDPDGGGAFGETEDRSIVRITLDPLELSNAPELHPFSTAAPSREAAMRPTVERIVGDPPAAPRTEPAPVSAPIAASATPPPTAAAVDPPRPKPFEPREAEPTVGAVPELPPPAEEPIPSLTTPDPPAPGEALPLDATPEVPTPPDEPIPSLTPDAPPSDAQLSGHVSGPALGDVAAVVVLGPDNLLREAARVAPDADGRWSLSGLDPGRYRVQLASASGSAIASTPRFALVRIEAADDRVVAPAFRALRRLE